MPIGPKEAKAKQNKLIRDQARGVVARLVEQIDEQLVRGQRSFDLSEVDFEDDSRDAIIASLRKLYVDSGWEVVFQDLGVRAKDGRRQISLIFREV